MDDDDRKRAASQPTNHEPSSKRKRSSDENDDHWTPGIHRAFVEAIFSRGINSASPSVILHHMLESDQLNGERIKSRLQKYRKNKSKSIEDFMAEYDSKLSQRVVQCKAPRDSAASRLFIRQEARASTDMRGAEAAALLTLAALSEASPFAQAATRPYRFTAGGSSQHQRLAISTVDTEHRQLFDISADGVTIPFPRLSDQEAKSPIGVALRHVIALVHAMNGQLNSKRAASSGESIGDTPGRVGFPEAGRMLQGQPHAADGGKASTGSVAAGAESATTVRHGFIGTDKYAERSSLDTLEVALSSEYDRKTGRASRLALASTQTLASTQVLGEGSFSFGSKESGATNDLRDNEGKCSESQLRQRI